MVVISSPEGGLAVTRLVGSVNDLWITKNETAAEDDPDLLTNGEILGAVQMKIPYLGQAAEFLWSLPGLLTILVVGLILLKLPGWLLRPGRLPRPQRAESPDYPVYPDEPQPYPVSYDPPKTKNTQGKHMAKHAKK